eukprot:TRINITY_DN5699_c0_g1_i1.p1 TRINITY_DN5699_c0_g1~~TRINITY_DN5699_c0_g1_i1.p1  ORF type:complete len:148 (+),score=41.99 TRINITY_DN5699_c0_g1_i1:124-567(+)
MNLLSSFKEFIQKNFGKEDVNNYLSPLIEILNIITFPVKSDLLDESIKPNLWPTIDPAIVANVLMNYQKDEDDPDGINEETIDDIQELSYEKKERVFELDLSYDLVPMGEVLIPIVLAKDPNLSFLKRKTSEIPSRTTTDDESSESW